MSSSQHGYNHSISEEVSHTLLPTNDVYNDSVEEPVEYPVGHSIVPQDNTDQESVNNYCINNRGQDIDDEIHVQLDDFESSALINSCLLSGPVGYIDESEKFADDEEFECKESDDEKDSTLTGRLLFISNFAELKFLQTNVWKLKNVTARFIDQLHSSNLYNNIFGQVR